MSLADRLERCYSGAVYDVMRDLGRRDCALPPAIRPIDPARKLAGPIWTATGRPADGADHHETLLSWTGLLRRRRPITWWFANPTIRRSRIWASCRRRR